MDNIQIIKNVQTSILLEYYGIRMEETKEIEHTTYYYISVPESSTIEINDQELDDKIKTADGLISIAKDFLVKMMLDSCRAVYDNDEFIQHVENNISEYVKVYAAIRKGEVWTKEMGEARIAEIEAEFQQAMEYEEV